VNSVYTPPELRRQGYATAAVAELSRVLLAEGYPACVLYTDLANPTSNSIYQRIGYEPVADAVRWFFG
jgi:predicted GNAT family acetyltransferase